MYADEVAGISEIRNNQFNIEFSFGSVTFFF